MRKTNLATAFLAMALSTGAVRAQEAGEDLFDCLSGTMMDMYHGGVQCTADNGSNICSVRNADGTTKLVVDAALDETGLLRVSAYSNANDGRNYASRMNEVTKIKNNVLQCLGDLRSKGKQGPTF